MTSSASAFIDAAASVSANFSAASMALAYWRVLQALTAFAAVVIFVSSIDDLFIDLAYWWIALVAAFRRLWRPPPSRDRLARARTLARFAPDDPESTLCVAQAAMEAREKAAKAGAK